MQFFSRLRTACAALREPGTSCTANGIMGRFGFSIGQGGARLQSLLRRPGIG